MIKSSWNLEVANQQFELSFGIALHVHRTELLEDWKAVLRHSLERGLRRVLYPGARRFFRVTARHPEPLPQYQHSALRPLCQNLPHLHRRTAQEAPELLGLSLLPGIDPPLSVYHQRRGSCKRPARNHAPQQWRLLPSRRRLKSETRSGRLL